MQQHAYGFQLVTETGLDLVSATLIRLLLVRPSGSIVSRLLSSFEISDGEKGIVSLQIQSGDLSEAGVYKIQFIDETPGRYLPSSVGLFNVDGPNLS